MGLTDTSTNFSFLAEHDPIFLQLVSSAERAFASDPNTTLIKLRQFGEAIAQDVAARCGVEFDDLTTQAELLYRLSREAQIDPNVRDVFHILRIEGNKATHQFKTQHKEALDGLKLARSLAIWFHQSYGKQGEKFRPESFQPLKDPSLELNELQTQIAQLRSELQLKNEKVENNDQFAQLTIREKEEYAELAQLMADEAHKFEQIAKQHEADLATQKFEFDERIKALQSEPADQGKRTQQKIKASTQFTLNEELTRILIDQQLIEAGWEADTQELTYQKGARPEKGKNKAIAEWPTIGKQAADYVLFVGLIPIGIVEAKRENTNVAGKIPQAERYAKGFKITLPMQPAWQIQGSGGAWSDGAGEVYVIPFVYSCNGRPFVKQIAEQSGTWFRDVREPSKTANHYKHSIVQRGF